MATPDTSAFLIWQKIQPVPTNDDVAEALRGEIHDPLWLLSRQWQLGEFNAEDAGMATFAHLVTTSTPVQRFLPAGSSTAIAYNPEEKHLNVVTESITASFSMTMRIEAGRMWQKMLINAGKVNAWKSFTLNPLLQFKKPDIKYEPDNPAMMAYYDESHEQVIAALSNGRMIDGSLLFKEFQTRKASDFLSSADNIVDETGKSWMLWVKQVMGMAEQGPTGSWDASRLEYSSLLSAPLPDNTAACLQMPEHNGERLEGFSWERISDQPELKKDLKIDLISIHRNTFIPTQVTFPSMPCARWWEIEETVIDFGNVQAEKTDLGLLPLTEFGLTYSNDWLFVPLPLPVGRLAQIRSMRVTDVFGVQSYVKAAQQNNNWELFQLTSPRMQQPKGWLYLPPVNNNYLQSEAIEEVHLLRDEMANMVWGVEATVQDNWGFATEGRSASIHFESWLTQLAGADENTEELQTGKIDANFKYSIGTTVPPNWIPFIPVRNEGAQIVFRRAAMPRFNGDFAATRIRPRTEVLSGKTDTKGRYNIKEEEIAASGITVRQLWRRSRWFDGRNITWLVREKNIGRHRESSGLQFDVIK
jgi:hypothetical protein